MTQLVAVKFNEAHSRTYTYSNNGDLVEPGDRVNVSTPQGEKTVTVDSVTDEVPPFQCKEILGKFIPEVAANE